MALIKLTKFLKKLYNKTDLENKNVKCSFFFNPVWWTVTHFQSIILDVRYGLTYENFPFLEKCYIIEIEMKREETTTKYLSCSFCFKGH
jgi:hypothetical protein